MHRYPQTENFDPTVSSEPVVFGLTTAGDQFPINHNHPWDKNPKINPRQKWWQPYKRGSQYWIQTLDEQYFFFASEERVEAFLNRRRMAIVSMDELNYVRRHLKQDIEGKAG